MAADELPTNGASASFRKPMKLVGKKRKAEEDILSILEQQADENGSGGLGTREQKAKQLEADR